MTARAPIAISYRPKQRDYLPVVVAGLRRHLDDWPIVLLTEEATLPPARWRRRLGVEAITDWRHSPGANKTLRLWEHHYIFARHFERWIWWHDDMLLLRPLEDPATEFSRPLVRHGQRRRPNRELKSWQCSLWDTLGFFRCLGLAAPNPVLHIPRTIERQALLSIPQEWNRKRLLFEPTYLLWHWHRHGVGPEAASDYRKCVFAGAVPPLTDLERSGHTIFNWGRHIDHDAAAREFGRLYPTGFG